MRRGMPSLMGELEADNEMEPDEGGSGKYESQAL